MGKYNHRREKALILFHDNAIEHNAVPHPALHVLYLMQEIGVTRRQLTELEAAHLVYRIFPLRSLRSYYSKPDTRNIYYGITKVGMFVTSQLKNGGRDRLPF